MFWVGGFVWVEVGVVNYVCLVLSVWGVFVGESVLCWV